MECVTCGSTAVYVYKSRRSKDGQWQLRYSKCADCKEKQPLRRIPIEFSPIRKITPNTCTSVGTDTSD